MKIKIASCGTALLALATIGCSHTSLAKMDKKSAPTEHQIAMQTGGEAPLAPIAEGPRPIGVAPRGSSWGNNLAPY